MFFKCEHTTETFFIFGGVFCFHVLFLIYFNVNEVVKAVNSRAINYDLLFALLRFFRMRLNCFFDISLMPSQTRFLLRTQTTKKNLFSIMIKTWLEALKRCMRCLWRCRSMIFRVLCKFLPHV
jgi:hypothetical protein